MRIALMLAALLVVAARVDADDAAKEGKQLPSDETIIKLCGDSLANMFGKCGVPVAIVVNADKMAILDYGSFAFSVKDKTVTGSYFFPSWQGTFKGAKYGDTKEQVVKVLGSGYSDVNGKTGAGKDFEAYGWELPEQKATFWLYFTDDKVSRVQITLKK